MGTAYPLFWPFHIDVIVLLPRLPYAPKSIEQQQKPNQHLNSSCGRAKTKISNVLEKNQKCKNKNNTWNAHAICSYAILPFSRLFSFPASVRRSLRSLRSVSCLCDVAEFFLSVECCVLCAGHAQTAWNGISNNNNNKNVCGIQKFCCSKERKTNSINHQQRRWAFLRFTFWRCACSGPGVCVCVYDRGYTYRMLHREAQTKEHAGNRLRQDSFAPMQNCHMRLPSIKLHFMPAAAVRLFGGATHFVWQVYAGALVRLSAYRPCATPCVLHRCRSSMQASHQVFMRFSFRVAPTTSSVAGQ